jgi:hypothetical protein
MKQSNGFSVVAHPDEFFRELVVEAMEKQSCAAKPETEYYLVRLLSRFMSAEHLYRRDESGGLKEEPLALMIQEATQEALPPRQSALFRQVGDVSLYTAGYFQDSLVRKAVDVDYYVEMGRKAYAEVRVRTEENVVRQMYEELADRFSQFVEVLADVSDQTTPKREVDLLRQYELWVRTRSERAAKALQEAGILPNATVKKGQQ